MRLFYLLFLPLVLASYTTLVRPSSKECFFEDISLEQEVTCTFLVLTGGSLDINIQVYSPNNVLIFHEEAQHDGAFTFTTREEGNYQFCFDNSMSTVTSKSISFTIHVGWDDIDIKDPEDVPKAENLSKMERIVSNLAESINEMFDEQHYQRLREARHRDTNESTNTRVMYWSIVQCLVLITVSIIQIYYLHHFFEHRRSF